MPIIGSGFRVYSVIALGETPSAALVSTWNYLMNIAQQAPAQHLADLFAADILEAVATLQNTTVHWSTVRVIDHMDDANFVDSAVDITGSSTGVGNVAPFVCFSWRLNRSSRDMRGGWKRWAGLTEDVVNGTVLDTAFVADIQAVVDDIENPLQTNNGPANIAIIRDRPTPDDPGIDPDDPTTWRYTLVSSIEVKNRVTTQNSRKSGSLFG